MGARIRSSSHGLTAHTGGDWRDRSACRDADPELFYPVGLGQPGHLSPGTSEAVARAQAVCALCPVQQRCLDHALDIREPHGIWGGLTPAQRAAHVRLRSA